MVERCNKSNETGYERNASRHYFVVTERGLAQVWGEISELEHSVFICFRDQQRRSEASHAVSLFFSHTSYVLYGVYTVLKQIICDCNSPLLWYTWKITAVKTEGMKGECI